MLVKALSATQQALRGQAEWLRLGEQGLRISVSHSSASEFAYPAENDVLGVLEAIRDAEKAIQEYDDFVK